MGAEMLILSIPHTNTEQWLSETGLSRHMYIAKNNLNEDEGRIINNNN
jgi:hypothetical protein